MTATINDNGILVDKAMISPLEGIAVYQIDRSWTILKLDKGRVVSSAITDLNDVRVEDNLVISMDRPILMAILDDGQTVESVKTKLSQYALLHQALTILKQLFRTDLPELKRQSLLAGLKELLNDDRFI
ncbi:MAG: hypothetical protein NUV82_00840 [Candidatus Komeilibacteria bacterium]|nr:hypothetical protein [Candidatus Komeilibacteria bacterium]